MFRDRKQVWMLEYVIGAILVSVVMVFIVGEKGGWSEPRGWAYLLFLACSGLVLITSGSAMRQRLRLAKRIATLEQTVAELKSGAWHKDDTPKRPMSKQQLVSSTN